MSQNFFELLKQTSNEGLLTSTELQKFRQLAKGAEEVVQLGADE